MKIVNEVVIATWPGGYQLIRASPAMFGAMRITTTTVSGGVFSREKYESPFIIRAMQYEEMAGKTATLFLGGPKRNILAQFTVKPNKIDKTTDRESLSIRQNEQDISTNELYGFLLSFYPLLGIGLPNLPDIVDLEITPIDPGPITRHFDAATYLMLGLAPPYLWPIDDFAEHLGLIHSPESASEWLRP